MLGPRVRAAGLLDEAGESQHRVAPLETRLRRSLDGQRKTWANMASFAREAQNR